MRLFSKHLYHGTPHAFDKFDTEHIGTGEGAQVHGWGLYFAENKDVANEYKTSLTSRPRYKIEMDGKEIIVDNKDEFIDELKKLSVHESIIYAFNYGMDAFTWNKGILDSYKRIKNKIEKNKENANKEFPFPYLGGSMTYLEALKKAKEIIDWTKEHDFNVTPDDNKLITVEIPDNLVFAEEDEPIREQPEKVIEALKQIDGDVFKSAEGYKIPRDPHTEENIKNIIKKYIPSDEFTVYALETIIYIFNKWHYYYGHNRLAMLAYSLNGNLSPLIHDDVNWNDLASELLDFANQYKCIKTIYKWDSFKKFYDDYSSVGSPKETSLELEKLGVNGIHYDGRQDGSCYVIFNPEYLKIVEVE